MDEIDFDEAADRADFEKLLAYDGRNDAPVSSAKRSEERGAVVELGAAGGAGTHGDLASSVDAADRADFARVLGDEPVTRRVRYEGQFLLAWLRDDERVCKATTDPLDGTVEIIRDDGTSRIVRVGEEFDAATRTKADAALDAIEIRATCDELAADYQVPPDVLKPLLAYADHLEVESDA